MAGARSYDCDLNLKATELRLALPGSDEPDQQTSTSTSSATSRKRPSNLDTQGGECTAPPSKAQIVGWPPVQSYRKSNLRPERNGRGSGLFVKVNMDGAPFLRKIDLKAHKSYVELLKVLEEMFKVEIGRYTEAEGYSQSDYAPSYEDKDGDWMLVGDVPWDMFVSSCKRLRIIKRDEAKGLCL